MSKAITCVCFEEIEKEEYVIEHGIYNGFGKILDLPSTKEIKSIKNNFNPIELGDIFINIGNTLKQEQYNITNISLKSILEENHANIGKMLNIVLTYDTKEKENE